LLKLFGLELTSEQAKKIDLHYQKSSFHNIFIVRFHSKKRKKMVNELAEWFKEGLKKGYSRYLESFKI